MNRYIYLFVLSICFSSCKTILITDELQNITTQNIKLGSVGEQKKFLLESDYNHTALPNYFLPIKLQSNNVTFNKPRFKVFTKAKNYQSQNITINYIDSLSQKPKFLKLEIADRISVINTLNNDKNKDVFQFLQNKREANLVTSIAIAFNNNEISAIMNADEVFLESAGIKDYVLKIYNKKEVQQTIHFKQGVVFAYQTSKCCWKQNDKYQLEIVDIVESNDRCPDNTYISAKRAKKKINYFKL